MYKAVSLILLLLYNHKTLKVSQNNLILRNSNNSEKYLLS